MASVPSRRFLILGASGQLGQAFLRQLGDRAEPWLRSSCDLARPEAIALPEWRPAAIINCAAFNDVDGAEADHRDLAMAVNAEGPARLARLAADRAIPLLHFSTDYVFGGDALDRPRIETDPPAPVSHYGRSKLAGERAVLAIGGAALVVRVAHLYGGDSLAAGRVNLVRRWLERAHRGEPLLVTRGQHLNPTAVGPLVSACRQLLADGAAGLYHLAGAGGCTAEEFATALLRLAGVTTAIRLVELDDRPAPRARFTVLENRRWNHEGRPPLPPWPVSLTTYVNSLR